jgi:hypothetical protein
MTDPITPEYLAELAKLCEAATPGPWLYRPLENDDWGYVRSTRQADGWHPVVATARDGGVCSQDEWDAHRVAKTDPFGPNAEFIAASREAIPRLIGEIERQAIEIDKLKACEGVNAKTRRRRRRLAVTDHERAVGVLGSKLMAAHVEIKRLRKERGELEAERENIKSGTAYEEACSERDAALAAQRDHAADLARIGRELGEAQAERDCAFEQNALLRKDALYIELQKVMEAHNAALADVATLREELTDAKRHAEHIELAKAAPEAKITNEAGDRADTLAHEILGAHCACYAEAWPAHTCANEADAMAAKIRATISFTAAPEAPREPSEEERLIGTFVCPICLKDTPHTHSAEEVQEYQEYQKREYEEAEQLSKQQATNRSRFQVEAQTRRQEAFDKAKDDLENWDKKHPCPFCRDLPRGAYNLKFGCDEWLGLIVDMKNETASCPECHEILAAWE